MTRDLGVRRGETQIREQPQRAALGDRFLGSFVRLGRRDTDRVESQLTSDQAKPIGVHWLIVTGAGRLNRTCLGARLTERSIPDTRTYGPPIYRSFSSAAVGTNREDAQ